MLGARMMMAASGGGGDGAGPDGTTHYVEVTVASSQVASNQTDFPVYVDLSDLPAAFHSRVRSDGGDIRVTKPDGTTQLPREVVAIDTGANTGELHFLADSLSSSVDTVFRIYYGNASATEPAITDTYGRNEVWADYAAVYHLGDASGSAVDATGNGNDGTPSGAPGYSAEGQVGDAVAFDGDSDYFETDAGELDTTGDFTLSAWIRPDSGGTAQDGIISRRDGGSWNYSWRDKDQKMSLLIGSGSVSASTSLTTAVYQYIAVTHRASSGAIQHYRDGGTDGSGTRSGSVASRPSIPTYIGRDGSEGASDFFPGRIDEARVRFDALPADWIAAEYTNQNTPGTFYSVGSEQPA